MLSSIANVVSNIANVDAEELFAAEDKSGSVTQIVKAFEEQLANVEVPVQRHFTTFHTNIAVQVYMFTSSH